MRYLILGAGAAGLAAVEAIRSRDPEGQIILCSAEEGPPYSLCALPDLVAGEIEEKVLFTTARGQMKDWNVDFRPGWQAETLEMAGKATDGSGGRVGFTNREWLDFDRLLIATGSEPLLPPLPGLDRPGIFTRLDLAGCRELSVALPVSGRVAVIGGGFLGVEMAQALVGLSSRQRPGRLSDAEGERADLEVILVEMEDRLLASMLDRERSRLAQEHLEVLGVQVVAGTRVTEFDGQGESGPVEALACEKGDPIDCDLAVMAVGVRPNVSWLEGSGLEVGPSGGLAVDERMGTQLPGVFAAGDLIESWDHLTGTRGLKPTWTNAAEQGRIAGLNMTAEELADGAEAPTYNGWDDYNVVHIGEVPFVSCGQVNDLPSTIQKVEAPPQIKGGRGKECRTSLYIEDDRLVGLCTMELPPNIGHLHHIIREGERLPDPDDPLRSFYESSLQARREVRPMSARKGTETGAGEGAQ